MAKNQAAKRKKKKENSGCLGAVFRGNEEDDTIFRCRDEIDFIKPLKPIDKNTCGFNGPTSYLTSMNPDAFE